MLKLPVDISTFSELITSHYVYVDKTQYVYNMITGGRRFFLSRPRRFGKSLLVSTLKEVLTANKAIFNGLWINSSDYSWQEYGVINLDFSTFTAQNVTTFQEGLRSELSTIAQDYNVVIDPTIKDASVLLKKLVSELFKRFGRVAILVDEYDSPILKTLHNESLSKEIRDTIQHFFTTIKGLDAQVQFAFITGVSSFAKAGLFSGINNLRIMTLDDQYAAICGYTDTEVDHYFADYITEWAHKENNTHQEIRQHIKKWYNGYHFGENVVSVYNPFSLMNALNSKKFENFWFQSGTPTFLVELLKKQSSSFDIEEFEISKDFLGMFDVGNIPTLALMFQAGYLTIISYDADLQLYKLDYPNEEVRVSFQKYLLEVFAHISPFDADRMSRELRVAFIKCDIEKVVAILRQLFAHVPYQLHMQQEKYYHSLLMMICIGAGIKAQSEYSTSHAQIDLVLEFPKIIHVIEVKFNKTAEEALAQIEERRYYERFIKEGKEIMLLGLAFKREPSVFDITYALKQLQ